MASRLVTTTPHRRRGQITLPKLDNERTSIFDLLENPIGELLTSFQTLQTNFEQMREINDSLTDFNLAFGGFVQGLQLNAVCINFPEAPNEESFKLPEYEAQLANLESIVAPSEPEVAEVPTEPVIAMDVDVSEKPVSRNQEKPTARVMVKKAPVFPLKRILDSLPDRYREQNHRKNIEAILKLLRKSSDGVYLQDIIKFTDTPKNWCNIYLNMLCNEKHLEKISKKGLLYRLDPVKYPPLKSSK
ncbi:DASH complex subunit dam1 [Basidiobolus ranarum]|uniref:DASH complex subunit DAM1 n=1 Tax=Basidiobolus ranarum TaxID=34480 RepID=A0ABR2WT40_9FUNG